MQKKKKANGLALKDLTVTSSGHKQKFASALREPGRFPCTCGSSSRACTYGRHGTVLRRAHAQTLIFISCPTHTHTQAGETSHTQDPCESKTFLSAQVQARPPNRGVCTFIHGLFFGIWLLYNYQPRRLLGPFCTPPPRPSSLLHAPLFLFHHTTLSLQRCCRTHEDCDLNGF